MADTANKHYATVLQNLDHDKERTKQVDLDSCHVESRDYKTDYE
jgi:hypothetical protein